MLICGSACLVRLAHDGRGLHPIGSSCLHDDHHSKLPGTTARVHVFPRPLDGEVAPCYVRYPGDVNSTGARAECFISHLPPPAPSLLS